MTDIVGKLWGFCHTLRHDGIDYGDYIEQLTYLLFLKMIEEKGVKIPSEYAWSVLREKSGVDLTDHYMATLRGLGKEKGMLGDIYAGAMSRFSNPVNLKRLVNLIDEIEWTGLNVDVKAAAYEGLLEKSAAEGKKGAGQYFTPRILIQSIVRCVQPDPRKSKDFTVHDPAAGTGGFLVCAYEWLMEKTKGGLERSEAKRILTSTYSGTELVPRPRRLALMNLYPAFEDGVGVLRSSDVRWLQIDKDHVKRISPDIAAKYSRTFLKGGEILVTVRGTLGGISVVPMEMAGYNISREVVLVTLNPKLDTQFFSYTIASIWSQNWLSEVTKGVAYTGINIKDLKRLPLPVPPIAEQREIVTRVKTLFRLADAIGKRVEAATERAEKLTQAILAKAFRGELVPTEAELARREGRSYEPASALLARIKTGREVKGNLKHSNKSKTAPKNMLTKGIN